MAKRRRGQDDDDEVIPSCVFILHELLSWMICLSKSHTLYGSGPRGRGAICGYVSCKDWGTGVRGDRLQSSKTHRLTQGDPQLLSECAAGIAAALRGASTACGNDERLPHSEACD